MSDPFDVVVVGAGIHGVGVAQAAAAHGYSVLLLEQTAPAAGTSSRSSKLIHGGLRYLESFQFGLVRECLAERALLLRNAPELVRLIPFHIPIYRETRRRPFAVRAGLSLYALLAGLRDDARFTRLQRVRWNSLDGLETRGLDAVFRYYDAQTDDAALTCAVLASAVALGAETRMPARLLGAQQDAGLWLIRYEMGNGSHECTARVLVNATGPWVNAVLAVITPRHDVLPVELVQGAHLELAGSLHAGAYYLEAPRDGRAVFALPWRSGILLGTTETPFEGEPTTVMPLADEEDYLLETFVRYFPSCGAGAKVTGRFAGLRVLPHDARQPYARARDTRLALHRNGAPLLSLYGGKLTAYRATAEKAMAVLAPFLPGRRPRADTRTLRISPAA